MLIGCYRLTDGEWKRFDIIAKASSVIWTRRFYEVGSFQLQIKKDVLKADDIIVHGTNAGIVMRIEEQKGIYNITGYDLKGIAHFRKFSAETIATTSAESKIKAWATTYLATGTKAVEGLTVAPDSGLDNKLPGAEISEGKLSDVLEQQCKEAGLGWDITFEKGKLIFDVLEPRDISELIFSERNRTLESAQHIIDHYDEVNNSGSGIRLREGDEVTEASDYITAVAKPRAKDYRLGDYVSVEKSGTLARLQITEIQYVYEPNNVIVVPSFGEVKKNIIKKLMKG